MFDVYIGRDSQRSKKLRQTRIEDTSWLLHVESDPIMAQSKHAQNAKTTDKVMRWMMDKCASVNSFDTVPDSCCSKVVEGDKKYCRPGTVSPRKTAMPKGARINYMDHWENKLSYLFAQNEYRRDMTSRSGLMNYLMHKTADEQTNGKVSK